MPSGRTGRRRERTRKRFLRLPLSAARLPFPLSPELLHATYSHSGHSISPLPSHSLLAFTFPPHSSLFRPLLHAPMSCPVLSQLKDIHTLAFLVQLGTGYVGVGIR
jgi:hypothetical protein